MADLHAGYNTHFRSLNPMDAKDFQHSVDYYERLYGRFLPPSPAASVLDLGCGGGHFLHYIKTKGFDHHLGVDRDSVLCEFVRQHITPNVRNEDIFAFLETQTSTWSVVALNDVVEHLTKDAAARLLNRVHGILEDGGRVFMKTINMSSPLGQRSRYIDITHEQGYTEESLEQLLRLSGLQPIHIGPAEPSWVNALFRLGLSPVYRSLGRVPRVVTANLVAVSGKVSGMS